MRSPYFRQTPLLSAVPAIVTIIIVAMAVAPAAPAADREFEETIQPLIAKYCYGCHGPEKKKGGLDITRFKTTDDVLAGIDVWKTAVGRVNVHEMPPKSAPKLEHREMDVLDRWYNRLPKPKSDCNEIAHDENQRWYRGYVLSRRLTHSEYRNALRDLLGLELDVASILPGDGSGGEGFHTNGNSLYTSTILIEKYLQAAGEALAAVYRGREAAAPPGARAAYKRLVSCRPGPDLPARAAAARIAGDFARRAFRRPVATAEVERLLGPFDKALARGDAFEEALLLPLKAVLVSPHFLFVAEPEPEAPGVYRLDDYQLAARLALFLWSSLPDEELSRLAGEGRLDDPDVVRGQVRRMLHDPKARALGEDFALEWLDLDRLAAARPDPERFPAFDAALARSLREEVVCFFQDLVGGDRSLLDLLDARYTFVDERLARHYGIEGVSGAAMRRVDLPDRRRGGVLGPGAMHVVTSHAARTSPVLRGKWLLETVLGARVPPPPQAVNLAEATAETKDLTLRQRLELHRTNPECAGCHERMDPLGFGLENFDADGRWRADDGGKPLDASGNLPSGESFTGPAELKDVLLQRKDEFLTHFLRKLLGYALGRDLNKFDQCVVENALKALQENDYRAGVAFEAIALSAPFQQRFARK